MSSYIAEFIGTLLLMLMGNGVVAGVILKGTKSEQAGWPTIVLAWGLAVTFAVYAVGAVSGAHLNPALTIAFAMTGSFPADMVAGYILAQVAGAFVGAVLVWVLYWPHWSRTPDAAVKQAVFCTAPAIYHTWSNLLSEIVGTMVLMFGIQSIGAQKFADGLNPLVVGALIVSIGFSLGGTTGFAINPARDFGPRLAYALLPVPGKGDAGWAYAWIPVVGPIIGACLGAFLYHWLFITP